MPFNEENVNVSNKERVGWVRPTYLPFYMHPSYFIPSQAGEVEWFCCCLKKKSKGKDDMMLMWRPKSKCHELLPLPLL